MLESNDRAGVPNIQEAEELLNEAGELNPGPWVQHSLYASKAAQIIAENCEGLNPEVAAIMGMLHDIGRRFGVTKLRHTLDGYNFLMEKGFYRVAKICLTHSFDWKDIRSTLGKWDCNKEEYEFVKQYIESNEYDDYDRLIQLCDCLALSDGYCLLEKRMIDVALRHGTNEYSSLKWKATFEIKEYFELIMGKSVYSVLPGVVENTFGL